MFENIENFKIGIIGGGRRCKALLESIFNVEQGEGRPQILGVADKHESADGLKYAQQKGIFTTGDYRELFSIEDIDLILELTTDDNLQKQIRKAKPPGVLLADHHEAQALIDYFRIKRKKAKVLKKLRDLAGDPEHGAELLEEFYAFVMKTIRAADRYARETRENLITSEATMSQIINGSAIPTFVIDAQHKVTHWNRACEKLTGYSAEEIIGTDGHWKPFRSEKRPTMADLILEGLSEEDLWRHYGTRWQKPDLIAGGYAIEEYFPHLGKGGTWLFFTAAPIRTPDGIVVGAIETLWDRTKQKQAQEERERQNRELAKTIEELRAKEQTMAQIINGSTIPTFVINRQHRVTHWNKALERLTGYLAEQIVGTSRQWAPFYEDRRPSMADVILDQVEESQIQKLYGTKWRPSALIEGAYEAEVFFPNLGDNGKWCWFTAAPIRTPEGEVIGAIETIWDKTEDRKLEKEREQHTTELATFCSIYATLSGALNLEGRVRAAIEEVAHIFLLDGICIFIAKPDGRFHLRYNHGFSENLCYSNRIAGSQSLVMKVASAGRIDVFSELPLSDEEEIRLLRQDGYTSLAYIPIADKDKRTFGVIRAATREARSFNANDLRALELIANRIGVAIENALLEEDVKRKASFQAKLIGSSNNGIVATDEKWKVLIFNPAAEKIFDYAAGDLIGKLDAHTIFPQHLIDAFDQVLASGGGEWNLPWQETTITSKTGQPIPVRFSGTVLREKHKMMGIVAFFHDLREIKRLERELVNAERLAAIGQTTAGMAHCVKNILHGLKGGSYMVNIGIERNNPEKLKTGWQMVQRNIGRTSDLVQDLLSYSKEREPEAEPCQPNEIAADVCELMQQVAGEHHVAIETRFSPEVGEVVLDPRSLHRCLLNLVSNAIDACRDDPSPGKKHCVTVSTARLGERFVCFNVQDNGSGMSEEVKSRLFSSFFSTKGAQGTGLGLLVTHKLIEEHKGQIEVMSQLGVGTTFSVRLPLDSSQSEHVPGSL